MSRPAPGGRDLGPARAGLWAALSLPLVVQTGRYADGILFYGEYLHWTGEWAVRGLILTLAATPLHRAFPAAATRWLLRRRRDLGVATFAYAAAHTAAYVLREGAWQPIWEEALSPDLLTGWLALAILAALAATSYDRAVRALGPRWRTLHRTVYAGAALTFAHWWLTAFDRTAALVHLAVLMVLLGLRIAMGRRQAPGLRRGDSQ